MLVVPNNFQQGLTLLRQCPSGAALLARPELDDVQAVTNAGLQAYGSAMNPTRLELTANAIGAPHQACVLMHELTHCLDLSFWGIPREQASLDQIGATEINAHFNQGLIARELKNLAGTAALTQGMSTSVNQMVNSNSVFGRAADMNNREDVAAYLLGTVQYAPSVTALIERAILYYITLDSEWTANGAPFHCEYHLHAKTMALRGEGYW